MKSLSRWFVFALLVSSIGVFTLNCTSGARPSEETTSDASTGGDKTVVDGGNTDGGNTDSTPKDDKKNTEPSPMKGKLFINEVAAAGEPNDWFELYNSSDKDIDLSEYTVADDLKDDTKRVKFPKGTIIKAGAYMRFEAKGDSDRPFKLGGDEELGLWDKDGKLVDSADWNEGDSPAGKTWGRFPNGTGDFKKLDKPTPGAANVDNGGSSCTPTTDKLVINEIVAAGDPNDWFELYNGTCKDIDLSDYTVSDDLQDAATRKKFPKGTIIKAGEYKRFDLTSSWPDFKLGSDEEFGLWDKDGKLVDSVDWNSGDSPAGGSFARMPNGTGKFKTLKVATPGKENKPLP